MSNLYADDTIIPGNDLLPSIEPSMHTVRFEGIRNAGGQKSSDAQGPTALPQDSFTQYIFVGPFMLGSALLNMDLGRINMSMLLGTFVNVSVLGYLVNLAAGRENKMDAFGPIIVGGGQVLAGILIAKPLPAIKQ